MKVKIITLHGSHNFGAMLQAFALKEQIANLGHQAYIIDYRPKTIAVGNRRIKWSRKPGVLYRSARAAPHFNQWRNRYRAFEKFRASMMNLTRHYSDFDELQAEPPEADAYVCGSDQIWNPERAFQPVYFLEFGGEEVRRLSYAASFGISELPGNRVVELGGRLETFDAISVRENEGREIVRQAGRDADVVVDPTLLLDRERWERVATPFQATGKYILTYCLEPTVEFDRVLRDLAIKTSLPVYHIPGPTVIGSKPIHKVMRSAGPAEFLGLFQNASYVVTNSFHGTAFALNLGRPLIGIQHTNRNSRMTTLLESLGWPNSQVDGLMEIENIISVAQERSKKIGANELMSLRLPSTSFLKNHLT